MVYPEELGENAFASVVRPQDLHKVFMERSGRTVQTVRSVENAERPCAS
jgi:hypothetical protein